jgi:hypothetical protein
MGYGTNISCIFVANFIKKYFIFITLIRAVFVVSPPSALDKPLAAAVIDYCISPDILRAVFIRSFFKLLVTSSIDLGSSPICPLVASFNAWSRLKGFFLSTLIVVYYIDNIVNRLTQKGQQSTPEDLMDRYEVTQKARQTMTYLML